MMFHERGERINGYKVVNWSYDDASTEDRLRFFDYYLKGKKIAEIDLPACSSI